MLSLLIDTLRQRGLLEKICREKQQSGIEGHDVFSALYEGGLIVHEKKGGWRYGLQAEKGDGHMPEEWVTKEEWVKRIDNILNQGKGQ